MRDASPSHDRRCPGQAPSGKLVTLLPVQGPFAAFRRSHPAEDAVTETVRHGEVQALLPDGAGRTHRFGPFGLPCSRAGFRNREEQFGVVITTRRLVRPLGSAHLDHLLSCGCDGNWRNNVYPGGVVFPAAVQVTPDETGITQGWLPHRVPRSRPPVSPIDPATVLPA